ncbi:class I SAM-dependent methyltransferase [Micromonospora sp. NPDC050980]|uniref:class I SAM-dependent methyltransferase n=1 Tax=Micromonospora sp. NPDC050980 TaxID=3155161 RepID=UPI0033F9460E
MRPDEIQRRATELGPWVNGFEYDSVTYPRDTQVAPPRVGRALPFFDVFPDATRILELGALEGADTIRLASRPGVTVVAVEGRADNLSRASFVLGLHGLTNVRLVHADVEQFDLRSLGRFDVVLCTGLLYHLQRPWDLLRSIADVSDGLFLSTHYWGDADTTFDTEGYVVKLVHEDHPEPRTRALTETTLWFDRPSLLKALTDAGFGTPQVINERVAPSVCDIVLAARRAHQTVAGEQGTSAGPA